MHRGVVSRGAAGWAAFGNDQRGTLAAGFGLALVGMVSAAGAAVDLAKASNQRSKMQAIADGAVMAAARQFRLAAPRRASCRSRCAASSAPTSTPRAA